MASGQRQDGVRVASGWRQEWFTYVSGSVRVVSGWRQDQVRKMSKQRQDGVKMASVWRQDGVRERQNSPIPSGTR